MSAGAIATHRKPLTVDEAAEYLGMKPRFIRRLIDQRRIPFFKVGRFVRLDPDVLDQFLADSVVPASEWQR
jgi:excisionase family DNA binding protein